MDTTSFRVIPALLHIVEQTEHLLGQYAQQVFQELGIAVEKRGKVDFRYLGRFWSRRRHRSGQGYVLSIKKEGDLHALDDGVGVDDDGRDIDGYTVFMMKDGTIDLIVLNTFLEEKASP